MTRRTGQEGIFSRPGRIRLLAAIAGLALMITAPAVHYAARAITSESNVSSNATLDASTAPGLADNDGNGIADGLERAMGVADADAQIRVIVTMDKGLPLATAQNATTAFQVRRRFSIINGFAASLTRAQIQALARTPGVLRVEEDIQVKAHLQDAMQAYGVKRVHDGIAEGLPADYDGSGVGVCIVYTGIDASHSELNGGKVQGFCDATTGGCYSGDPGTSPYDDHGHGTHVASTAAGDTGVAPAANVWGAKVLYYSGGGYLSDIVAGVQWCAAKSGVHIINLSLGATGSSDGTDSLSQATNTAALTKVVTLSAGNSGPGLYEISTPAAAERPIAVAASADWLSPVGPWRKGLAVFSSRGPTADNRMKPDITAPGVDITAARAGGGTITYSGTSMSSPFVAGVAALMLDANPSLTPATVKEIIADTAVPRGDKTTLDGSGRPKNLDFGWGELDAFAAVAEAAGVSSYTPTPFPTELYLKPTIADGTVFDYEFEVTDPSTQVSINIFNGGIWRRSPYQTGQDFNAQLFRPNSTLHDESTCPADSNTQCGYIGRQETMVADPADSSFGGNLPLGFWTLRIEPWGNTDGKAEESADVIITMGPVTSSEPPPPEGTPTANFTFTTDGLTANFTDTSSDTDGTIASWSWDFGDGNSSTAQNPSHPYAAGGTYAVKLTVTDNDGNAADVTKEVAVTDPNQPSGPTAVTDSVSMEISSIHRSTTIEPLVNDIDPYGSGLTVISAGPAPNGNVDVDDNEVIYTRDREFKNACETFPYTILDGLGRTDEGVIQIAVGDATCTPPEPPP